MNNLKQEIKDWLAILTTMIFAVVCVVLGLGVIAILLGVIFGVPVLAVLWALQIFGVI